MKRFLIAAALIVAATGNAFATTNSDQLLGGYKAEIMALAPGVNLDELSVKQLGAISRLFNSSESRRASNDLAGQLQVILGWM